MAEKKIRTPNIGEIIHYIPRGAANEKPVPAIVQQYSSQRPGMVMLSVLRESSRTWEPISDWIYFDEDPFLTERPQLRQSAGTWREVPKTDPFELAQKSKRQKAEPAAA